MMYAKKIKMKYGCGSSENVLEISEIYIDGFNAPGFYTKADVYNHLMKNPKTIKVDIFPYPYLLPAISPRGEKYVKSAPNQWGKDNLLNLPRV